MNQDQATAAAVPTTPKLVIRVTKDVDTPSLLLASVPGTTRTVGAYTQREAVASAISLCLEQMALNVSSFGLDRFPAIEALFHVERGPGVDGA